MDTITLSTLSAMSHCWYKNKDNILPFRLLKTAAAGLKGFFIGYDVEPFSVENRYLRSQHPSAMFTQEIDKKIFERQITNLNQPAPSVLRTHSSQSEEQKPSIHAHNQSFSVSSPPAKEVPVRPGPEIPQFHAAPETQSQNLDNGTDRSTLPQNHPQSYRKSDAPTEIQPSRETNVFKRIIADPEAKPAEQRSAKNQLSPQAVIHNTDKAGVNDQDVNSHLQPPVSTPFAVVANTVDHGAKIPELPAMPAPQMTPVHVDNNTGIPNPPLVSETPCVVESTVPYGAKIPELPAMPRTQIAPVYVENISMPNLPINRVNNIAMDRREPKFQEVRLPNTPLVTNVDHALQLLEYEHQKQVSDINRLKIDNKYEKRAGDLRKEFHEDLERMYLNAIDQLIQCDNVGIQQCFREQIQFLQKMGIYRYWCLRQPADGNPIPHYPGRVSIINAGETCGPDAALLQFLHSGTMNYFIWRPLADPNAPDAWNSNNTLGEEQREFQRLYQAILFGSPIGGAIPLKKWIRDKFKGMLDWSQVNSYEGSLFNSEIVWKPKPVLKGLNSSVENTREKLIDRILNNDWRACRLFNGYWHYHALIKDANGRITTIDDGNVGTRQYQNSQELLNNFLGQTEGHRNPSQIEFWE